MPSLALLFHLIRKVEGWEGNTIPLDIAQKAAAWCEFLELHAKKVYAGALNRDLQAAHALRRRSRTAAFTDGQTPREISRAQWALLRESEDVHGGLSRLEALGWLRLEDKPPSVHPWRTPNDRYPSHPEIITQQGGSNG